MKIRALILIAALLSPIGLTSCASAPATVTTPAGQQAFKANEVLKRVEELQNATIQANQTKAIPDATAVAIVRFTVATAKTAKAAQVGWAQAVAVAWADTKRGIPPADAAKLGTYLALVDAAILAAGGI